MNIVEQKLKGTDKFLIEVLILSGNKITVFFDGDNNISISDCQKLSRFIESLLDIDYPDYQLTVSSSGMDRPIKLLRQYKSRIGRELDVITYSGDKISGILTKVDKNGIELEHPVKKPGKEILIPNSIIPFERIKSAKIVITIGK